MILCDPCARVTVPVCPVYVSHVCPGSPWCLFTVVKSSLDLTGLDLT